MKAQSEKQTIDVYGVSIKRFYQRSESKWKVKKVIFDTNFDDITYRPYKEKSSVQTIDGLKANADDEVMVSMQELSPIILKISDTCIKQGMCKIKARFHIWKRKHQDDCQYMQKQDIENIEVLPVEEKAGR